MAVVATRLLGCVTESTSLTLSFDAMTGRDGRNVNQEQSVVASYRLGDAKADDAINIGDALFIAQYLAGLRDLGVGLDAVNAVNAASVKQDGAFDVTNIADVLFVAQHLVGLRDGCFNTAADEFQVVQDAVNTMITENLLSTIPNVVSANTAPCTTGTQDMAAFPDDSSVVATADKLADLIGNTYTDGVEPLGDKDGYPLYAHDITGNNDQTDLVSYLPFPASTLCYTVLANGDVQQYAEDGTPLAP